MGQCQSPEGDPRQTRKICMFFMIVQGAPGQQPFKISWGHTFWTNLELLKFEPRLHFNVRKQKWKTGAELIEEPSQKTNSLDFCFAGFCGVSFKIRYIRLAPKLTPKLASRHFQNSQPEPIYHG